MTAFDDSLREAERTLTRLDPKLGRVIARVGPCELTKAARFEPFSALLNSIAHQQLNGKAAQTIVQRVKDRFADGDWPDAATMAKARLPSMRKCGLSQAKSLAIRDLAAKTLDGTVPSARALHKMPEAEIIERLTQVRGIGQWTVEMMLMFRLGRLDVLPVDDFGVRKGFTALIGEKDMVHKKTLATYGEKWAPYRSVAAWYLWRVADGR
jgi:DNA-3-methyladenine glycosylase II